MDEERDRVPQCRCRVGGARGRMDVDFVIAVALAPDFEIQRADKIPRHVVGAGQRSVPGPPDQDFQQGHGPTQVLDIGELLG